MWLKEGGNLSTKWKYVEAAYWWVPEDQDERPRVVRLQKGPKNGRVPVLLEWKDIPDFRSKYNNLGLYTSVFYYDSLDLNQATRLGSLYFDFDSADADVALDDARKVVRYLLETISEDAIRIYFTGAKGFHVEAEAYALGIGPSNDLPGHFRYIARELVQLLGLTTVDFAVYDLRRMWRLPNSQHQNTGLYKIPLTATELKVFDIDTIKTIARSPRDSPVPDQQFEFKANEWYREWSYKKEAQENLSIEERIARFEKFGSALAFNYEDSELEFDPIALFEGCPAIMKLWEQAERTHDLPHEARLFLCSLLTYTPEAERYLHAILSNCEDYNSEKSHAHIQDWVRRRELGIGGRPYTCQRANSGGVGCGDCNLESREKLERVGNQLVRTGELVSPSPWRFAYSRKKK